MDDSVFKEAYTRLNASQKEAVDTIEGPVMVIAGPGTGKTQILTLRIANILRQTDTRPENILALTFTDAGTHAMRARLESFVGHAAYHVPIQTFHGFASRLIAEYPDAYPNIIGARAATDLERIGIIEDILANDTWKLLRPQGDPSYYVRKIEKAISDLKKEYVTPDTLAERLDSREAALNEEPQIHEKGRCAGKPIATWKKKKEKLDKTRELLAVYRLYEAALRDAHLYDFEDMIVETVHALEGNEDMLRDLQETYHYILADEHQDVNVSQNRILDLLASYHDSPNIFVVGDEKQAIYRFQGASLGNFLYFEDRFPGTNLITLTSNYRSQQAILDAAHQLIKTDDETLTRLRVPLDAARKGDVCIETHFFPHEAIEDAWIINAVESALEKGVSHEEIAVIVRKNATVEHVAAILRRHNIPVRPSADSDILEHPITRAVEVLFAVVAEYNDIAFAQLLQAPYWNIQPDDLVRMFTLRRSHEKLIEVVQDTARLTAAGVRDTVAFIRPVKLILEAREKALTQAPHEVLAFLVRESGFLAYIEAYDPFEGVRVLRRLYDEIESLVVRMRGATLADVARDFASRRMHKIPLNAPFIGNAGSAIQVMTAHKSKGLEFDTVIIPRCTDANWGKSSQRQFFELPIMAYKPLDALDAEDDERRLFYVAMTRAKNTLLFAYSESNEEGKIADPSRFIEDITTADVVNVESNDTVEAFDIVDVFRNENQPLQVSSELVAELFLSRKFAVTHLNNYLDDPWQYFYRNLLRIPEPKTPSLMYGTVVHKIFELAVKYHEREKEFPTESMLSTWLMRELEKQPLTIHEVTQLHERGLPVIVRYIAHLGDVIGMSSRTEFPISVTFTTGDEVVPEIQLTGNIDRVDYDKDGNRVRVIDYKTGKAKTRNDIEGKTKTSNGNLKRQLVFYALLFSLYEPGCSLPEFVLSFVEPKTNGVIAEESYTITSEEIEELKKEIIRVAREIVQGEFLKTGQGD